MNMKVFSSRNDFIGEYIKDSQVNCEKKKTNINNNVCNKYVCYRLRQFKTISSDYLVIEKMMNFYHF